MSSGACTLLSAPADGAGAGGQGGGDSGDGQGAGGDEEEDGAGAGGSLLLSLCASGGWSGAGLVFWTNGSPDNVPMAPTPSKLLPLPNHTGIASSQPSWCLLSQPVLLSPPPNSPPAGVISNPSSDTDVGGVSPRPSGGGIAAGAAAGGRVLGEQAGQVGVGGGGHVPMLAPAPPEGGSIPLYQGLVPAGGAGDCLGAGATSCPFLLSNLLGECLRAGEEGEKALLWGRLAVLLAEFSWRRLLFPGVRCPVLLDDKKMWVPQTVPLVLVYHCSL